MIIIRNICMYHTIYAESIKQFLCYISSAEETTAKKLKENAKSHTSLESPQHQIGELFLNKKNTINQQKSKISSKTISDYFSTLILSGWTEMRCD